MQNIQNLSRQNLLDSALTKETAREVLKPVISSIPHPVLYIIANNYSKNKNYYPNLAKVYDLKYYAKLPKPLSSQVSVAQQIPAKLLVENSVYAFDEGGKLVIATAEPFLEFKVFENILSYTSHDEYNIAISNPNEIRNALAHAYYYDLTITSEELISVVNPKQSTKTYSSLIVPKLFPIFTILIIFVLFFIFPQKMFLYTFIVMNLIYFMINPFKIYIFFRSFKPTHSITVNKNELKKITDDELPVYTVLVPLRNESVLAKQIIVNMLSLDYPVDKLDLKFIVDIDDHATIETLEKLGLGKSSDNASRRNLSIHLVKVPKGTITTKPRAIDYAVNFARGRYTTIYDAEDKPDVDQLKKVFLAFQKSSLDTITVQSRLNYYNSRQNTLTRLFSLEYGFWFDYYLPGLQEAGSPIPLGGTSNHFITSLLKKIGNWDAFNVTEDADLGLRIYRYKLKTAIVNSKTLEEANSKLVSWIRQRTRWQKGFLITLLVHTARPFELIEDLGFRKFILSLLTFGGSFFLPLFNPVLWLLFILSLFSITRNLINLDTNLLIYFIALFNLVVGNLTYILIHFVSAIKNKRYDLAPFSLLLPLYWMLISVASIRALIQFFRNPYYWEKTKHGLGKLTS